jgi:hypothetical protein
VALAWLACAMGCRIERDAPTNPYASDAGVFDPNAGGGGAAGSGGTGGARDGGDDASGGAGGSGVSPADASTGGGFDASVARDAGSGADLAPSVALSKPVTNHGFPAPKEGCKDMAGPSQRGDSIISAPKDAGFCLN